MSGLQRNLRVALRRLWKRPGFTVMAVLCLAVGIGATTALFSVVDAIFLRPLPLHEPHRLVAVFGTDEEVTSSSGLSHLPISLPNFEDLAEQSETCSGLAAFSGIAFNFAGPTEPERISGQIVTADYFEVLGVRPLLGQVFDEGDDRSPVAVLSHGAWRDRFGADPGAIGRSLLLNGQTFTILGVAPEGFRGTSTLGAPELWIPMGMHPQVYAHSAKLEHRAWRLLNVVGRLAPSASLDEARSELATISSRLERKYPDANEGRGVTLLPLTDTVVHPDQMGSVARAGALPMVMAFLVLLVACISVACLLLARAMARSSEIALRVSLGATRGQVVRQLLTESVVLALLGGLVGCGLAYWGKGLLLSFLPPAVPPEVLDLRLSTGVLGFTLALSVLTGVLFGLAPALQVSHPRLAGLLKSRERRREGRLGLRTILVGAQIALSAVSLVAAGLFLHSLNNARDVELGFDSRNLATMRFELDTQGYDAERRRQFQDRLLETVRTVRGVESATLSETGPLDTGAGLLSRVVPEGRSAPEPRDGILVRANAVAPNFFEVVGTTLLRGRTFRVTDRDDSRPVAIVDATAARSLWRDGDPVGRRFSFVGEDEPIEVVGVVRDGRYDDVTGPLEPYVFLPLAQREPRSVALSARATTSVDAVMEPIRDRIRDLDANLPIIDPASVSERVEESLWAPRIAASLLALFALAAVVITAVGLYGVVEHSVTQRQREIGVRIALGARRPEVLWMILKQSLLLAGVGIAVGFAGALAVNRLVESFLFGIDPTDPRVFATVALLLTSVVTLAATWPALRASRVDPATVLREE